MSTGSSHTWRLLNELKTWHWASQNNHRNRKRETELEETETYQALRSLVQPLLICFSPQKQCNGETSEAPLDLIPGSSWDPIALPRLEVWAQESGTEKSGLRKIPVNNPRDFLASSKNRNITGQPSQMRLARYQWSWFSGSANDEVKCTSLHCFTTIWEKSWASKPSARMSISVQLCPSKKPT